MSAQTLTAGQRQALLRMGDLGIRGAAQALAQLLGAAPALAVSSVEVVPLRRAAALLGPGGRVVAGIAFRLYGGTTGRFLVLLPREAAIAVVAALTGRPRRRTPALTEENQAVLKEVGNILGSAYVSAVANQLGVAIIPSIPHLVFDLAGAVLEAVLPAEADGDGGRALLVTRFADAARGIEGMAVLVPGGESGDPLLDLLAAGPGSRVASHESRVPSSGSRVSDPRPGRATRNSRRAIRDWG